MGLKFLINLNSLSSYNSQDTPITVILLPVHPASFAHKFLFQQVPGCNSIADMS